MNAPGDGRQETVQAGRARRHVGPAAADRRIWVESDDVRGERKPRDKDGKPKGGRYKRDFGVPEDKAQENFTDPDSRIMKRAGGGFDAAYNGQLAVDEAPN